MKNLPYDETSVDSIYKYALRLEKTSLSAHANASNVNTVTLNKGSFGQLLEELYFFKKLDSVSQPDFPYANLELKTAGLKKLKKGQLRAKERLVLNIINYDDLILEDFYSSSVYKKNAHMLLIFYNYIKESGAFDYIIELVGLWNFPNEDLKVIKHDWELIQKKVEDGEAHTLSEGDTFYLGACTKGASANTLRSQPNSEEMAKQRAFSLKAGYVNHIIAKISGISDGSVGKIITKPELNQNEDIEALILNKFTPYLRKTTEEIAKLLQVELNLEDKGRFAKLTNIILGANANQYIEEFDKAEVTVKTIRINESLIPHENISFPAFSYVGLVMEDNWQTSEFNQLLEKKFLFVFFKTTHKGLVLEKAKFWNMPYTDRLEAMRVWMATKELIKAGQIVREVKTNRRYTYFPKKSENRVAHVRPHATNKYDTYPLFTPDKLTKVDKYMKHSFWLNNTYIRDSIYLQ